MKTLMIFLMLLGGICQAQTNSQLIAKTLEALAENQSGMVKILDDVTDDIIALQQNMNRNAHYDIDKFRVLEKRIAELEKNTLNLKSWVEYEKECYNDSTFIKEKWVQYDEYPGDLVYREKTIPSHWVHKKPNFEGFIEYMKRKSR